MSRLPILCLIISTLVLPTFSFWLNATAILDGEASLQAAKAMLTAKVTKEPVLEESREGSGQDLLNKHNASNTTEEPLGKSEETTGKVGEGSGAAASGLESTTKTEEYSYDSYRPDEENGLTADTDELRQGGGGDDFKGDLETPSGSGEAALGSGEKTEDEKPLDDSDETLERNAEGSGVEGSGLGTTTKTEENIYASGEGSGAVDLETDLESLLGSGEAALGSGEAALESGEKTEEVEGSGAQSVESEETEKPSKVTNAEFVGSVEERTTVQSEEEPAKKNAEVEQTEKPIVQEETDNGKLAEKSMKTENSDEEKEVKVTDGPSEEKDKTSNEAKFSENIEVPLKQALTDSSFTQGPPKTAEDIDSQTEVATTPEPEPEGVVATIKHYARKMARKIAYAAHSVKCFFFGWASSSC